MGNLMSGEQGQGLQGLLGNPLFNAGMGLLQANNANFGENNNPYQAVLGGLQRSQQNRDMGDQRAALKKARERQDELNKKLQEMYAAQPNASMQSMAPPTEMQRIQQLLNSSPSGPPDPNTMGGAQNPFGQALGTDADAPAPRAMPTSSEITAIMMQYGNPAQQQSAFKELGTNARFKQGLAAEEQLYRQRQGFKSKIGQYNPRDYTTESWAESLRTGDSSKLVRYERTRTFRDADGITHRYDAATGKNLGAFSDVQDVAANKKIINQSAAEGTAQGKEVTSAKQALASIGTLETQMTNILADPSFESSVGALDAITGRIGEMFGSDEGVLGGEVERVSNNLVTEVVKSWKGAISERELDFFQNSVPGRTSSPETWRRWFKNEFLPRKQLMARVASGEVFSDPRLEGGQSDNVFLDVDIENLINKYLGPQGSP